MNPAKLAPLLGALVLASCQFGASGGSVEQGQPGVTGQAAETVTVVEPVEPAALLINDGDAIGVSIDAGQSNPASLGRTRPCLTLGYPSQPKTPGLQACLRPNGKQFRIKHDGYGAFLVPADLTRTDNGLDVTFSAAAAMIKPGQVRGEVRLTRPNKAFPDPDLGQISGAITDAPITSCDGSDGGLVRDLGTDEKVVAITFDDGPSWFTAGVLDVLREHGVRATFYVVGSMFSGADDERVRRIVDEGHEVANHSYSHANMAFLSGSQQTEELRKANQSIAGISGTKPCTFRAPYGSAPDSVVESAKAENLVTVGWNVDPEDWTDKSAEAITETALEQVRPGSIILLHDGGEQGPTVEATGYILTELRLRGYRIVTAAEGLNLDVQRSAD